jgi:hypothetical protein
MAMNTEELSLKFNLRFDVVTALLVHPLLVSHLFPPLNILRFCNPTNPNVACNPEALNEHYASVSNEPFNISPLAKPPLLKITNN